MAGGVAQRLGVDVTIVRVAFVLVALAGGFGAAAYLGAWLVLPLEGQTSGIAARAVSDRRGLGLVVALLPAFVVVMVVGAALHLGFVTTLAFPGFVCAAAAILVWRNCDPDERMWLRQAVEPVVHLGPSEHRSRRSLLLRVALGVALLGGGAAALASRHPGIASLQLVVGVLLVVAAFVVLFGPWWLRIARDLVDERAARARAEDRADMAARVHDSVLQTLAMIQRSAEQPQRVVQLARAQERELRSWLFEGEAPGAVAGDATTLAAAVQSVANEVESAHGVPVDVVTVGDCLLDDRLRALLGAAREATVNASKWSGAPSISLFSEVEPGRVSVFVRDRGKGFELVGVGEDRRGIAESIRGRVQRNGGRVSIRSALGEGTEVELTMARRRER